MYSFLNDYSEGAHPGILDALTKANDQQEIGYGEDALSINAQELIKQKIENQNATVHFVSGGTQANLIVLAALLSKPYEAVIAVQTGHINTHEAGAIEATGHKIVTATSKDGKLKPDQIRELVAFHTDEHMVKPKVVFISQATELGTVYTKKELEGISSVCKELGLYLYMDGARLGAALTAKDADLSLPEIARLVDAFYIGGTKNGALLGEAVVIVNPNFQKDFRYHLKQRGALLAKGRILGVQFQKLFSENLYFDLASHANEMAHLLTEGIKAQGFSFLTDSPTNQIFPIFSHEIINKLKEQFDFYEWEIVDHEQTAVRLVTSWATPKEAVENFLQVLQSTH